MKNQSSKAVLVWIFILITMIYAMVVVGGLTRLTNSGLSMVDWKPILGVVPPVTAADWAEAFAKYKNFPEYQKVNQGMSLSEFKYIYYWEYGHRVLGRLIGMVFFFPFMFFWLSRAVTGRYAFKLLIAFLLGGAQGFLGWYMVKSGLVNKPHVSHFRLAAHLSLALVCFSYLLLLSAEVWPKSWLNNSRWNSSKHSFAIVGLVFLQIVFGALTAGLHAGLLHNTFPDMSGRLLGEGAFVLTPTYLNFFENPVAVQFVHRSLAWLVSLVIIVYVYRVLNNNSSRQQKFSAIFLLTALFVQFSLGVATLLNYVPIGLASMHQAGSVMLLMASLICLIQNKRWV